jgi:hypothetical protein
MATRKKKVSRKGSANTPKGFRKIEKPHMAGFWIPEKEGQSVRGVIQDLVRMTSADGSPNVWYNCLLTDNDVTGEVRGYLDANRTKKGPVEVGEGEVIGLSGAVLVSLLRGQEGKEVICVFTGLGEKKANKNQARLYDVLVKD